MMDRADRIRRVVDANCGGIKFAHLLTEVLSEELEIGFSTLTPEILEEEVRRLDPEIKILTYLHHNREKMFVYVPSE